MCSYIKVTFAYRFDQVFTSQKKISDLYFPLQSYLKQSTEFYLDLKLLVFDIYSKP